MQKAAGVLKAEVPEMHEGQERKMLRHNRILFLLLRKNIFQAQTKILL
jgi:hypothetical protein